MNTPAPTPNGEPLVTGDGSQAPLTTMGEFNFVESVDDMFGAPETPVTPATPAVPDTKEDQDRRYWQSQADRYRQELEQVRPYLPIAKKIASTSGLYERVIEGLVAPDQGNQPAPTPQGQIAPTPPQRPADFNITTAMSDGESSSARYLADMQTYQEQKLQYFDQRDAMREQAMQAIIQEQLSRQAQQQQLAELRKELSTNFGIVGPDADDFVGFFTQRQPTLEDYVNLYKTSRQRQAQPTPVPTAKGVIERKIAQAPSLVGIPGSNAAQQPGPVMDDNAQMTAAFLTAGKNLI